MRPLIEMPGNGERMTTACEDTAALGCRTFLMGADRPGYPPGGSLCADGLSGNPAVPAQRAGASGLPARGDAHGV